MKLLLALVTAVTLAGSLAAPADAAVYVYRGHSYAYRYHGRYYHYHYRGRYYNHRTCYWHAGRQVCTYR